MDQDIDIFGLHHFLEHINQAIKIRKSKDKDSTVNKTEHQSQKIQQVNPGGPDKQPNHQAPTISSIDKSLSRNRYRVMIQLVNLEALFFVCLFSYSTSQVNS